MKKKHSFTLERNNIFGVNMKDPFFDSYEQENLECCDIIDLLNDTHTDTVSIVIGKDFLRKVIHSYIIYIRDIDKAINGKDYAN